ncbi:MAG: hypothetical protein U0531_10880 [Dehalococcoidia bacterium]
MARLSPDPAPAESRHLDALRDLTAGRVGRSVHLPGGVAAERVATGVLLSRTDAGRRRARGPQRERSIRPAGVTHVGGWVVEVGPPTPAQIRPNEPHVAAARGD